MIQDVFTSLYVNRKNLPADLNVMGYLRNAVRNKCANIIRDKQKKAAHHLKILELNTRYIDQYALLEHAELKRELAYSVKALPDKCRQVFVLNEFANLNHKSISLQLGISVSTVEKHLAKAFSILRNKLARK